MNLRATRCLTNDDSWWILTQMTDWEQRYQDRETPWEKGAAAPPLVELLDKRGAQIFGDGRVIVPGCGFGHDVRALAESGIRALGVDLAASAIDRAKQYSQVMSESYELGDILDPRWRSEREGQFTGWWEHTCFCAIDPEHRSAYAAAAAELIRPGGLLAGVFFLNPFDPGECQEGPPFGTTIEEVDACFARWFERIDAWAPESAYPGREGREWIALYRRLANP